MADSLMPPSLFALGVFLLAVAAVLRWSGARLTHLRQSFDDELYVAEPFEARVTAVSQSGVER